MSASQLTDRTYTQTSGIPGFHLNLSEWEREFDTLCDQFDFPELYEATRWAVEVDTNWPPTIRRPKNIVDNAAKIVDGYRAYQRGKAT